MIDSMLPEQGPEKRILRFTRKELTQASGLGYTTAPLFLSHQAGQLLRGLRWMNVDL